MVDLATRLEAGRQAFRNALGRPAQVLAWGPGRVNVIGEHTDYNGGLALPAAINRWVVVALAPREDTLLRAHSMDFNETWEWDTTTTPTHARSWTRYVAGAMDVCGLIGKAGRGCDVMVEGDVPIGAGLSSSAAVEVALLNGLRKLWGLDFPDQELIRRGQRIEHEHLGLQSGLLDQCASQFSREGHLLRIDFRDMSLRHVSANMTGWTWVVVDTGVRRELAGSAYRDRVRECKQGLEYLSAKHPTVRHFRDITRAHLDASPNEIWRPRLGHVVAENQRVDDVVTALEKGDWKAVGQLLLASHHSLRDHYQVSCTELDLLVELAMQRGALGARMVGGGFGGCTLNLVPTVEAESFTESMVAEYRARTKRDGRAWRFVAVGGAGAV